MDKVESQEPSVEQLAEENAMEFLATKASYYGPECHISYVAGFKRGKELCDGEMKEAIELIHAYYRLLTQPWDEEIVKKIPMITSRTAKLLNMPPPSTWPRDCKDRETGGPNAN